MSGHLQAQSAAFGKTEWGNTSGNVAQLVEGTLVATVADLSSKVTQLETGEEDLREDFKNVKDSQASTLQKLRELRRRQFGAASQPSFMSQGTSDGGQEPDVPHVSGFFCAWTLRFSFVMSATRQKLSGLSFMMPGS